METRPLVIWCNLLLDSPVRDALEAGVAQGPGHRLLWAANLTGNNGSLQGVPDPGLAAADVAFGQPEASQCAAQPRLAWVHLATAGYTSFDEPAIRTAFAGRGATLTTSSAVFAEPCAQHVLGFMLAGARQLPAAIVQGATERGWPKDRLRQASVLLRRQSVLLVGFGAIGRRLTELLAPFHLDVRAVRRRPRGDEPCPTFAEAALPELLPGADHVVNLLPASADTRHFFDARRLAVVKRGAIFYNIGRGTTVDQEALRAALDSGQLRAAFLDVTDPEPLPPAHPLWTTAGSVITPHSAGGHADEPARLCEHFLANLRRREAGQPLADRVI
jgi:phosphoglycerate dehydrogenase-like enzyme